MKNFTTFLKNKFVLAFFMFAIIYPLLMLGIFLPSYAHINNSLEDISVAIVNEDTDFGKTLTQALKSQLPFNTVEDISYDEAISQLDHSRLAMVIEIPADFSAKITAGETPQINYYQSGHLSMMTSNQVSQITNQIADSFTTQIRRQKSLDILTKAGIEPEQAQKLAQEIETPLINNTVVFNAPPSGTHNMMAPFFLALAAYVFGLMGTAILSISLSELKKKKWPSAKLSLYSKIAEFIASLLTPIPGVIILICCGSTYSLSQLAGMWLMITLSAFASIQLCCILNAKVGQAGTFIATAFLLMQIISGSGVISRMQMLGFFKVLSYVSPLYYAVNGLKCAMYGGNFLFFCLVLSAICLLLLFIDVLLNRTKQTAVNR